MRRQASLRTWRIITPLLLLSSMSLNSATTAANNTDHAVSPLLALISSLSHRPDAVQPPRVLMKSPPGVVRQNLPRFTELAPLQVTDTLRSAKRSSSRLFLQRHASQPQAGLSPSRASSRQRDVFSRVPVRTLLICSFTASSSRTVSSLNTCTVDDYYMIRQ